MVYMYCRLKALRHFGGFIYIDEAVGERQKSREREKGKTCRKLVTVLALAQMVCNIPVEAYSFVISFNLFSHVFYQEGKDKTFLLEKLQALQKSNQNKQKPKKAKQVCGNYAETFSVFL